MKEIMDFNRFGKYFVSDLKSCAVNYGYSLILICLMGLIIYIGTVSMGLLFNGTWGGPTEAFRSNVFWLSMFVMAVTMPVKCYGGLTEKKTGSQWLMIPASKLEKFLSMVLITAVFIPMIAFCVSLGLDAVPETRILAVRLDATYSMSILSRGLTGQPPSKRTSPSASLKVLPRISRLPRTALRRPPTAG